MKIAVWHNLRSGGGKRALYDHVRGLIDRGHTVEAWCPPTADPTYLPLSELITEHIVPLDWSTEPLPNGLSYILSGRWDRVKLWRAMDRHCRQCAEEINQGGFDLLFTNPCILLATSSIGRYVKIPKVIYLQEPRRPLYEAPYFPWPASPPISIAKLLQKPTSLKKLFWDLFNDVVVFPGLRFQVREELASAKAFDTILVNSFFSRESVLRAYGLDAKVCYLGVDTKKFVNRHQAREDFVVGVGALVNEKNIKFAIEAVAKVVDPRPQLIWISNHSDSTYVEELKKLAYSKGVSFQVKIKIDDEELIDILNRAAMEVYAPRLEPFGYAPIEANACGLPVVAVAEGGVRETVVDQVNGLLVEHDPQAMATVIQGLMNDKNYARQLGEKGCIMAKDKWSYSASIDRLESRFIEILNKNSEIK